MKYLLSFLLLVFTTVAGAQPFFLGMVSQGSGNADAGSGSIGASAGPGAFITGGAAGAISGSQAQAGAAIVPGPGINFSSSGISGSAAGSLVGGASTGNAAGGSSAQGFGNASHYHASGFVLAVPGP